MSSNNLFLIQTNIYMTDITNIKEVFRSKRPELSEGSLRTYASSISNLSKASGIEDLNNDKIVLKYLLANKSEVGRKPVLSALVVLFNNDAYRQQMLVDAKAIKKEVMKQEMSEATEENWVSQVEIASTLKQLKKTADAIYKTKNFSNDH